MRQLTSLDAQFLALETPRAWGHVSGLAIYDPSSAPGGSLTQEDICRLVGERIHLLPPFTQKLVSIPFGLDHPYWADDPDFDLDFHIREIGLAPPGTDRQLAEQVARIVARPLDRARPLWELYLIRGLEGGRDALLTKVHHSAVDGVSGNEILSVMLDLHPEGREIDPPAQPRGGQRAPGELSLVGRGLLGLPRHSMRVVSAVPTALANLDALPVVSSIPGTRWVRRVAHRVAGALPGPLGEGDLLEAPKVQAPRTRFNGPISAHRRLAFGSLPLDTVKAVKNELGVTVNDVVVALCASMLRAWFEERGELPDQPLVAMIPVSVRTEAEQGTYGNRISAMFVPIPTDEPDARRRIERAHEVLLVAKERHKAIPAELMQDATQFVPPALMSSASRVTTGLLARSPLPPAVNLVISNVPGPRESLYCAGAHLMAYYPVSTIIDGAGLNVTVMSYRDHLDVGIIADREQLDDAWPMVDGMRAALEEFHGLLRSDVAAAVSPPVLVSP
ncbi:MAG TPA: wax ester/triacylglycerol synthase family O-acyltransferase [Solirubrobacteraceae bacterium]|jgi:WS/DGAT/MGAT family acyltransferase